MKGLEYKCYIDSIRLKIDNYTDFKNIFYGIYNYRKTKYGKYLYYKIIEGKYYIIFDYEKRKDKNNNGYILISFNGFKKYKDRDNIIEDNFYFIVNRLLENNIQFQLSKIDTSIDFYNVELLDLIGIQRKKEKRIKRILLEEQTLTELNKIKNNDITFYFEEFVTDESRRKHRAYLYNKTKKEKLKGTSTIYRFEVEIKLLHEVKELLRDKLNQIDLLKLTIEFDKRRNVSNQGTLEELKVLQEEYIQELKVLLLNHIKQSLEKYDIKCIDKQILFDYTIIEGIIELSTNIDFICNDINTINTEDNNNEETKKN